MPSRESGGGSSASSGHRGAEHCLSRECLKSGLQDVQVSGLQRRVTRGIQRNTLPKSD